MTEPSQYFKGRTVQEQMNEVIGYVDTRAAEVATTAIASDVAQVHQDMLDADADAQAAAASAAAAAGTLANAVKKTGEASQSIAGNIEVSGTLKSTGTLYAVGDASVGGNLGVGGSTNVVDLTATGIVSVPTPNGNNHAVNKKYVDDKDALDVHLAGNQTIADVKTFSSSPVVPTVATGTADTKAANGTKVKNELDNYTPMVRTTGNQTINGTKVFQSSLLGGTVQLKTVDLNITTPGTSTKYSNAVVWVDQNDVAICKIWVSQSANGQIKLGCDIKNSDNTWKFGQILAQGDVI